MKVQKDNWGDGRHMSHSQVKVPGFKSLPTFLSIVIVSLSNKGKNATEKTKNKQGNLFFFFLKITDEIKAEMHNLGTTNVQTLCVSPPTKY